MPIQPNSLIQEGDAESIRFQMDGYFSVSVSLCISSVFLLSARISLVYQAGTRDEEIFNQGWEPLRCVNQMDEQLPESWI